MPIFLLGTFCSIVFNHVIDHIGPDSLPFSPQVYRAISLLLANLLAVVLANFFV